MTALGLGSYAQASHTPDPSQEGRFGCCVLVGSEWFVAGYSPLERGLKGLLR